MKPIEEIARRKLYDVLTRNLLIEEPLLIAIVEQDTSCPKEVIMKVLEGEILRGNIYEPKVGYLSKVN